MSRNTGSYTRPSTGFIMQQHAEERRERDSERGGTRERGVSERVRVEKDMEKMYMKKG